MYCIQHSAAAMAAVLETVKVPRDSELATVLVMVLALAAAVPMDSESAVVLAKVLAPTDWEPAAAVLAAAILAVGKVLLVFLVAAAPVAERCWPLRSDG